MLAALVVATPAVGAATNWFGFGAPNHPQSEAQAFGVGNAIAGTTKLLSLRVPDPQGGPPWGMRVVTTQTGSCQEFGRVEDGQLGSLGIDDYWNDDHLFHPYPKNWVGQACGSGSAALGAGAGQFNASANIPSARNGEQLTGCKQSTAVLGDRPVCPSGSLRFVIFGQLGSDVKSITYEQSNHSLATERTAGKYGAFLLVFQMNAATCRLYLHGNLAGGGCVRSPTTSTRPFQTPLTAAIKAITYRNGRTCPIKGPGLQSTGHCQRRQRHWELGTRPVPAGARSLRKRPRHAYALIVWNFQDVWILLSANGNLRSLIASADHINVAIPSREEIEQSARRLIAAGLIAPTGDHGLKQTRRGHSLVRQASKGTRASGTCHRNWRQSCWTPSRIRLNPRIGPSRRMSGRWRTRSTTSPIVGYGVDTRG